MQISLDIVWLVLALVVGGVELMTGTVFLLAVSLALFAGALSAWLGASLSLQLGIIALVTVLGCTLIVMKRRHRDPDTVAQPDQGRPVQVHRVQPDGTAEVMYRGAPWQARAKVGVLTPGAWQIAELDGPCLVLEPVQREPKDVS